MHSRRRRLAVCAGIALSLALTGSAAARLDLVDSASGIAAPQNHEGVRALSPNGGSFLAGTAITFSFETDWFDPGAASVLHFFVGTSTGSVDNVVHDHAELPDPAAHRRVRPRTRSGVGSRQARTTGASNTRSPTAMPSTATSSRSRSSRQRRLLRHHHRLRPHLLRLLLLHPTSTTTSGWPATSAATSASAPAANPTASASAGSRGRR